MTATPESLLGEHAQDDSAVSQVVRLPTLTDKPSVYPGCCLALSTALLAHLGTLLPASPALTLSIRSGYGLLEALLLSLGSIHVIGVEVEPSPNQYLPPQCHRAVHGSRFLEPLANDAEIWLFIYPRRVGLVNEYLETHGSGAVKRIIWVGPQADWTEFETCFPGWQIDVYSADKVGGAPWEVVAVANRNTT